MSNYLHEAFDSDDVPRKNLALRKAHDEIERLRAENARLRDVLQLMIDTYERGGWTDATIVIARAAITSSEPT